MPPIPPVPPAPQTFTSLRILVHDEISRVLPGAIVEVLKGDEINIEAVTDANGLIFLSGNFSGSVTVRVTKEGFITTTTTLPITPLGDFGAIGVTLEAPDRVQLEPGKYLLTLATDRTCAGIPTDLQTRTYAATVVLPRKAGDGYSVFYDVHGQPSGFLLFVSGHDVGVELNEAPVVELTPTGRLEIWGSAVGTMTMTLPSTVSLSFEYGFDYGVVRCEGPNGSLTLTRN
jgi:hypothetical protein